MQDAQKVDKLQENLNKGIEKHDKCQGFHTGLLPTPHAEFQRLCKTTLKLLLQLVVAQP